MRTSLLRKYWTRELWPRWKSNGSLSTVQKAVARWIGCDPVEVIYTYSATYALNILALAIEQNAVIGKGDTILLSISEHHANIVPWQMLAERVGAQIKFITLDENYCINLDDLSSKLDRTVKIVSIQYASNVTGAVHPSWEDPWYYYRDRLFVLMLRKWDCMVLFLCTIFSVMRWFSLGIRWWLIQV